MGIPKASASVAILAQENEEEVGLSLEQAPREQGVVPKETRRPREAGELSD